MDAYLGVDIGLSGARAALITRTGRLLAQARVAAESDRLSIAGIRTAMAKAIRTATAKARAHSVRAMSVCAFGPSLVGFDGAGEPFARAPLLAVSSCPTRPRDDLERQFQHLERAAHSRGGRLASVLDLTGYLVRTLTGAAAVDHVTASDISAAFQARDLALPDAGHPASIAGTLLRPAARRLGLPAGIPVATGCYDSTADLFATGFGKGGRAAIVLGSTMVLGVLTPRPTSRPDLRSTGHARDGWFTGGWTSMAGSSLRLADRLLARGGERPTGHMPIVLPYFAGERAPVWNANARGMIMGIAAPANAADLRAAMVDGVALSAADIAERIAAEWGPPGPWRVTGGGTRNGALMQALSDAMAARLQVIRHAESGVGPALLAARIAGIDIALPVARSYLPSTAGHRRSAARLVLYRNLYQAVAPYLADLARVTAPPENPA